MAGTGALTTRLSTNGQVILPAAIRSRRHWAAGTQLIVEDTPDGVLLKPAPVFPRTTPDQVFGCLRYTGEARATQEMQRGKWSGWLVAVPSINQTVNRLKCASPGSGRQRCVPRESKRGTQMNAESKE